MKQIHRVCFRREQHPRLQGDLDVARELHHEMPDALSSRTRRLSSRPGPFAIIGDPYNRAVIMMYHRLGAQFQNLQSGVVLTLRVAFDLDRDPLIQPAHS